MDLISIIVPIYNVEMYLKKCIDSIIGQTYEKIEIILVDDGSTDSSPEICDEYAKIDKRIIVIHKVNGGLSDARNAGINISNGKYLVFVDSDDYVEKDMVEILYQKLNENKASISVCNYFIEDEKNLKLAIDNLDEIILVKDNKLDNLYNYLEPLTTVAWNKLYKREIFSKIRYPKGKIHEDEYLIADILNVADSIVYINRALYHYIQRKGSIMNSFNTKRLDIIYAFDHRAQNLINNEEYYYKTLYVEVVRINEMIAYMNIDKEQKSLLINKVKEIVNDIALSKLNYFDFKDKLKILMLKISPSLYIKIKLLKVVINRKGRKNEL